ncbi:MAG: DUF4271 domain-containing protein [Prevotella sp.]|jgi:hypothetical protein|nr:DUF4271 domain-containing protein [Prevotella sp.]
MNILPGQFPVPIFNSIPDSFKLVADTLTADTVKSAGTALADTARVDSVATDSLQAAAHNIDFTSAFGGELVGMSADPAPYFIGTDNLVTALMMVGLFAGIVAIALSWKFIARQVKNFFYLENERTTPVPDTNGELGGQGLLVAGATILLAVVLYCYIVEGRGSGWWMLSRHGILGVCIMSVAAYFLFKAMAYQFVNWVFFDVKKIEQWNKSMLFLTAMEGVAMTPFVMLMLYGGLSLQTTLLALAIVAILVKILTFYKCYLIFFKRMGAFLQIILYFCALELTPLVVLVGLMETFNNNLEINF